MKSNESRQRQPAGSPVVFVFFDPWTLVTGRMEKMILRMLDHGFTLLDFQFKTLSEADAEEIYRTNHPIREENSWHIARLVYPMGRSIGLLLGFRDTQSCACTQMQRLKGKANPALNRPGQLRYDFMAPNRCLSLMHSSDNLPQVRREAAVFFSADRVEQACNGTRAGSTSATTAESLWAAARYNMGLERLSEPSMTALFGRVRLRLLAELEDRAALTDARRSLLTAYQQLWDQPGNDRHQPVTLEAQHYLQLVKMETEVIAEIVSAFSEPLSNRPGASQFYRPRSHEPAQILRCLQILNDPRTYPTWHCDQQLPPGLLYDRWEDLLFRTHLFNFDDLLPTRGEPL